MILILGVTASGKGRLAFDLARKLGAEILSIDSMKVYRRMDIGTAKPPGQARREVPYHLLDVVEPSDSFNVGLFYELADQAIKEIQSRNKPVIAVGGTALYIKALLFGLFDGPGTDETIRSALQHRLQNQGSELLHTELKRVDPSAAERINPNDVKRIIRALEVFELTGQPISAMQNQFERDKPIRDCTIIGLRRDKPDASGRINQRVKKMITAGLVDEVRSLLAEAEPLSRQARCAIGYAEIINYLHSRVDWPEAVEQIKINTRRLAKGQRTWFKTFRDVHWLDIEAEESAESILQRTENLLESAGDLPAEPK